MRELITGIVLAGGRSRRMDFRDKSFALYRGTPLIRLAIASFQACVSHTVVVTHGEPKAYQDLDTEVRSDSLHIGMGPLAGLASVATSIRTPWVAIVACDMPLLPHDWVTSLYEHALSASAQAAYANQVESNFAAICAVARSDTLQIADSLLRKDKRSWAAWLDTIGAVAWTGLNARQLTNVNTLNQLNESDRSG
jgi:molybdopterin-guanine dinucleotide biosynthesis protein A